jgi:hypothetical protein
MEESVLEDHEFFHTAWSKHKYSAHHATVLEQALGDGGTVRVDPTAECLALGALGGAALRQVWVADAVVALRTEMLVVALLHKGRVAVVS